MRRAAESPSLNSPGCGDAIKWCCGPPQGVKETWYRRSYRSLEAVTLIKVYVQSRSYAADAVGSVNVKESSDMVKVKVEGAMVAISESVM